MGTRIEKPSSFPLSSGSTSPTRQRGAGRRRNHRQCGGARAAQVLVRQVEQLLIVRVGVDGRHPPLLDAEGSWITLASGARQLVVHEAFEMMWCFDGSYCSSLTPRTTVMSGFFAGAVMMTFFAPAARCLAAPSRSVKMPGGLEDDVDAEVLPRQLRRDP